MTFRQAVESVAELKDAWRPGLQAVDRAHRRRIHCTAPTALTGSVNLDKTLAASCPSASRWDYGIGCQREIVWVEVHPASSQHVQEVLDKLDWLTKWLDQNAPALTSGSRRFVWVASGRVSLPKGSPQRRRLAARGIQFAGERLQL